MICKVKVIDVFLRKFVMQYRSLYVLLGCAGLSISFSHSSDRVDTIESGSIDLNGINPVVERVMNTVVDLAVAKSEFDQAQGVASKVNVVIDAAESVAPNVIGKVDSTIDQISNHKDVQEASVTLELMGEIANQFADQNGNTTLKHTGDLIGNTSDLLKANNTKEVAKEVVEIVGDVNDLIKENRGFFKRIFSCCYPSVKKQSK